MCGSLSLLWRCLSSGLELQPCVHKALLLECSVCAANSDSCSLGSLPWARGLHHTTPHPRGPGNIKQRSHGRLVKFSYIKKNLHGRKQCKQNQKIKLGCICNSCLGKRAVCFQLYTPSSFHILDNQEIGQLGYVSYFE